LNYIPNITALKIGLTNIFFYNRVDFNSILCHYSAKNDIGNWIMKKELTVIWGVISLIGSCLFAISFAVCIYHSFLILGILAFMVCIIVLICGLLAFKRNSYGWGLAGVAVLVAVILLLFLDFIIYGD
jgi:hypothetical protein